jgi:hypothetical protein
MSLTAAMPLLWPFYCLLGRAFPRDLFLFRFDQSRIFDQTALVDLEAEICRPPARTPTEVSVQNILGRYIVSLNEFIFGSDECFESVFSPYSRRFMPSKNSSNFSYAAIQTLIVNFGLHAVLAVDYTLIHMAARVISHIMSIYNEPAMIRDLNIWLRGIRADNPKWPEALVRPEFDLAAHEMIRLGVIMILRDMVREASTRIINYTLPGFVGLISSAARRDPGFAANRETFLIEICTTLPTEHYLEAALRTSEITKATDPFLFFLFFALTLGVPWLKNAQYLREAGCMLQNLHLFPNALMAFIDLFKTLSIACDAQIVGDVMGFFFTMVHRIIDRVWTAQEVGPTLWSTFIVLVDIIARKVTSIEYGRVAAVFPRNLITEAYLYLDADHEEVQVPSSRRQKGVKK